MQDISKLLNFMVCPLTKAKLTYDEKNQELISIEAKLAYKITDGIPVMLPEQARKLNSKEIESFSKTV